MISVFYLGELDHLLFTKTTLLRYNLRIIKIIHLKYTIKCFQYIHRAVQISLQCKFRTFSSLINLQPLAITFHSLPLSLSPQQLLIYFLTLNLSIEFCLYVVFCDYLLSLNIMFSWLFHVVTRISFYSFLLSINISYAYTIFWLSISRINMLMDIWIISTFQL